MHSCLGREKNLCLNKVQDLLWNYETQGLNKTWLKTSSFTIDGSQRNCMHIPRPLQAEGKAANAPL